MDLSRFDEHVKMMQENYNTKFGQEFEVYILFLNAIPSFHCFAVHRGLFLLDVN